MTSQPKEFICRIPPKCFIHVLDTNTNITRLEVGPKTFIRKDHEVIVLNVTSMINIPPHHYCEVLHQIVKDNTGGVVFEESGAVKLSLGDTEIRLIQDSFPLYPGETIKINVTPLRIVEPNTALKLKAMMNLTVDSGVHHLAGDEWLFEGPGLYVPTKGVRIVNDIRACVIQTNSALRLRAVKEFIDRLGERRVTGEEWLIHKSGSYIPGAYEEVVEIVSGFVLTEKTALHLKAIKTFTDDYGFHRKNGEEWLVTFDDSEIHVPSVYEEVLGVIDITTLNNRQYCVILDPIDDCGKPQLGKKKLIKGEKSFFLCPGERLLSGIENIFVLSDNDGLILRAVEEFMFEGKKQVAGDRWLIRGPIEVIPPIEVEVECSRSAIALDKNEGIYVRDVSTGTVRSLIGVTYMLSETEELWAKNLPSQVEELLCSCVDPASGRDDDSANAMRRSSKTRDKTRVITYRVPHNAAVQIYDFKEKIARVQYGPDLVMLGAEEQFTLLSLSGGKPKRANQIKSLCLCLGPDFSTDIVVVETADHARLQLQVSYNWYFKVKDKSQNIGSKLFSVPDFIGDACKALASRIRASVAGVKFDDFHRNSSRIIRSSVFGLDDKNKVRAEFLFTQNNLVITSIDIQSVEPVDQKTRESLQRSVQLAIEITTKSQEANARHQAERLEQQAKGHLERQMINDEAEAEEARTKLLELKAASAAVESTGQAKAESQSRAESSRIEGHTAVEQAKLKAEASKIKAQQELNQIIATRKAEIEYRQQQNNLEEIHKQKLADIETEKFRYMIDAIGHNTLIEIARAGPNADVRLLQSLGLRTTLITDGNNPTNLFQAAGGLINKSICVGINAQQTEVALSDKYLA